MESALVIVLLLAFVQGVAEFLPISSSGHVVILSELLSPGDQSKYDVKDLNIALHFGTLGSILIVYYTRIVRLLTEDRRTIGLIVIASIPAALAGFTIEKWYGHVLENALIAGICLIVTGIILLVAARWMNRERKEQPIGYFQAFLIGIAQAFAILPGISRSGSTISTGVMLGQDRTSAATFSFLMAIPVIGGVGLLKIVSMIRDASSGQPSELTTPISLLLIGALVAFVVGIIALKFLIRLLDRGRFHWFAWWCIPVGICVVIWQML